MAGVTVTGGLTRLFRFFFQVTRKWSTGRECSRTSRRKTAKTDVGVVAEVVVGVAGTRGADVAIGEDLRARKGKKTVTAVVRMMVMNQYRRQRRLRVRTESERVSRKSSCVVGCRVMRKCLRCMKRKNDGRVRCSNSLGS
ncbi:uncharacterized protein LOC106013573 [Aplysia californica]|uniref:Uncharacterized protein LOC106013573 n=1 Tax=Aplysia californica TaxID=6500 RepID=A0ABM1ACM9_APLCA|nr:uncharacterized protein LOC106013573 [Aplysia californica]